MNPKVFAVISLAAIVPSLIAMQVSQPAAGPTLGAHTLIVNAYNPSSQGISTPPIDTQPSGSTILALVARGRLSDFSAAAAPTSNLMPHTPATLLGSPHDYSPLWPTSGEALFVWHSAQGGRNNVFHAPMAGGSDEITFAIVEIKNGGKIEDSQWKKVLKDQPDRSLSVKTTGPATLVAIWLGDYGNPQDTPMTAVPNHGFQVIDSELKHSWGWVQAAIATKTVSKAGTYEVEWTETPAQGAHLWLVAVQRSTPARQP